MPTLSTLCITGKLECSYYQKDYFTCDPKCVKLREPEEYNFRKSTSAWVTSERNLKSKGLFMWRECICDLFIAINGLCGARCHRSNCPRVFHIPILAFLSLLCENKKKESSDKMLLPVGIETGPFIASASKSNTIFSTLIWHLLARLRL